MTTSSRAPTTTWTRSGLRCPSTSPTWGSTGGHGGEALVASGGLCAPLTPIYSMPNFATEEEPVWDALPVFRAARGGVNVPTATYDRGHRRRDLLHLGGERRSRWHLRNQVLPGPGVPRLHGDGGADHRPLPRVREPERDGHGPRRSRTRTRSRWRLWRVSPRTSCSTGSSPSRSTSPTASRRSVP